ncbi:MAG: Wzz/FepE/Etk N-terminal domain-containing protein, partial [Pseudomonadota bacterium]
MPITEETSPARPPIPDYVPGMTVDEDEINLLDLFIVLLKHKVMIFSVVVLAGIAAVVISLRMPNVYRS